MRTPSSTRLTATSATGDPSGCGNPADTKVRTESRRYKRVSSDSLLVSLRAAVEAAPDDVPLRLHLAETFAAVGDRAEAVRQAGGVLQRDPENAAALG